MTHVSKSVNSIPIRLTDERWLHIVEEHCELSGMYFDVLETVNDPERLYLGSNGEVLAVRPQDEEKYLVVVYKEEAENNDGFVITAFLTKRTRSLFRRMQLWP